MRVTCPISGVHLFKYDYMLGFELSNVHPIFRAKKSLLLTSDMVHRFRKSESKEEKKLIYLAVLNTTDLIDWKCIAQPEPYIIEATFLDAITIASWVDFARNKMLERIAFPRYKVDVALGTQKMTNIASWISSIYDIRKVFQAKDIENDRKVEFNDQADKIKNELSKAGLIGQAFTKGLAVWALELLDVQEPEFTLWKDALQCPLDAAWCLDSHLMNEIYDFMQTELPMNNAEAITVMNQVKKLLSASQPGEVRDEDDGDESTDGEGGVYSQKIPKALMRKSRFEMIDDDAAEVSAESLLPAEKPAPPDRLKFNKNWEYLAAKAAWELLCEAIDKRDRGESGGKEYKQF